MCTVSATGDSATLVVTMNRDEQRIRLEGPLEQAASYCYPTDQTAGGTWCGINAHGLAFCLLNRYDAPPNPNSDLISRGLIIPGLLACKTVAEATTQFTRNDLNRFNGFRLLMLSRTHRVRHDWNVHDHEQVDLSSTTALFESSSSVASVCIPQQRQQRFQQWCIAQASKDSASTIDGIPSIHLQEPGIAPNDSVFMVRRDTHTKSICQLVVTNEEVVLRYWPAQHGWKRRHKQQWQANLQVVDGPTVVKAEPTQQ